MDGKILNNLLITAEYFPDETLTECIKDRYLVGSLNVAGRTFVLIDTTKKLPKNYSKFEKMLIKSYNSLMSKEPLNRYIL